MQIVPPHGHKDTPSDYRQKGVNPCGELPGSTGSDRSRSGRAAAPSSLSTRTARPATSSATRRRSWAVADAEVQQLRVVAQRDLALAVDAAATGLHALLSGDSAFFRCC